MATQDGKQQSRAQAAFSASEQRDRLVREMVEKDRAATDAKTARLRALRLAKEASEPPPAPKRKPKKSG